jgi:hypothetical protein
MIQILESFILLVFASTFLLSVVPPGGGRARKGNTIHIGQEQGQASGENDNEDGETSETIEDLRTEIRRLREDANRSRDRSSNVDHGRTAEPKASPPEPLTLGVGKLRTFLMQCQMNFSLQPSKFDTEWKKVIFVASYL